MIKKFWLIVFLVVSSSTLSYAQPIPNQYPVPRPMRDIIMALSEEWQLLADQSVKDNDDTTPVIANKSSYIKTHVFDLYTMLTMEEDHARNANLSRYACEALITNMTSFKDQLDIEKNAFQDYYKKQSNMDSKKTLDKFSDLLEKTKKIISQIEAETKKNYVSLDV
jgi:hypothetical protein